MQQYYAIEKNKRLQPAAVALGYFDGVHIGHRAVISSALNIGKRQGLESTVFTFSIGEANTKGNMLLTHSQRLLRTKEMGIANYVCPNFDTICGLSAQEFVKEILVDFLNAKAVFCGDNYKFGKKASGDINTLKTLCAEYSIAVYCVDTAAFENETVSSTRIKKALQNGDITAVNAMLEKPYAIDLPVTHGKALGRTLGFPTINQVYPSIMVMPKTGVYTTKTYVDGVGYPSVTGIGTRPTVQGQDITCETFIADFSGDLYNTSPMVEFYSFLAETKKFDSVDELKKNICEYAKEAKGFFKSI